MAISDFRSLVSASLTALTIASAPAQSADDKYRPVTYARVDLSIKLGKLTPDYREGSGRASSFIGEFAERHKQASTKPQSVTFPKEFFDDTLVVAGVAPPQAKLNAGSPVCAWRGQQVLLKGIIKDGNFIEDNTPLPQQAGNLCYAWLKARGMEMMQPTSVGETPSRNQ